MLFQDVCLTKLSGVPRSLLKPIREESPLRYITALNLSLAKIGYTLSQDLLLVLIDKHLIMDVSALFSFLNRSVGNHVKHKPMYKNFPQEVLDMSEFELYFNALIHYASEGVWKPESHEVIREFGFEPVELKEIKLLEESDIKEMFNSLLTSNDSLSSTDDGVLECLLNKGYSSDGVEIPYKEILCKVALFNYRTYGEFKVNFTSPTDILRVATHMSSGDVSLSENTRFKSFPRKLRRLFVKELEKFSENPDDFFRHRGKWVTLGHSLHVGEYSKKLHEVFKYLRSGKSYPTFNSKVEVGIASRDLSVLDTLSLKPGEFARRVTHLLRVFDEKEVENAFVKVIPHVSTKVLLQLNSALKARICGLDHSLIFPKGTTQSVFKNDIKDQPFSTGIYKCVEKVLGERFKQLPSLGKVWIDDGLFYAPIPSQMRSASPGKVQLARGTRLDMGEGNTIRMFVYWVGDDIDLSALGYNEDFTESKHISYTNLKDSMGTHSGDVTYAPDGASEFIDIDIEKALAAGIRYVAMNVYVYSGPTFKCHKECFVGWMMRYENKSNEIYEPSTVKQKIDLLGNTRRSMPVMFDLEERKVIWIDTSISNADTTHVYNTVENNKATVKDIMDSILNVDSRTSLYDLFVMHTKARGARVDNKEDADFVFGLTEGDVTALDINKIHSDFIK